MKHRAASILHSDQLKVQTNEPKFWSPPLAIVWTVGLFFGAQFVGALIVSLLPLLLGWSTDQTSQWLKGSAVAQFLIIAAIEAAVVVGLWGLLRIKGRNWRFIGVRKPKFGDLLAAVIGFAAYFGIYIVLAVLLRALLPQIDWEQKQQIGFSNTQTGFDLVLVFASLVLLPAIVEELLCRGFLYTALRGKLSFIPAAVATSVIFAVAHLQFGNNAPLLWVAAVDTFVLSMVLVYLREKRGSLVAPILLHMIKNSIAFLLLFVFMR